MDNNSPVIIGGVGGAGTRVYYTLCTLAGYNMGWFNTRAGKDCYPLVKWFFPRYIDPYLKSKSADAGPRRMQLAARAWLRLCYPMQRGRWGWKNPRTLYLLPFFDELFPSMIYIHVIRDGRDHAFNSHFSYEYHQTCLLSDQEVLLDEPIRKALQWSRLNMMAENYGTQRMKGRYLQSRLEDLCASPREEIARILDFLHIDDPKAIEQGIKVVRTPESLGRWMSRPSEQISGVEEMISPVLEHYRYQLNARQL